MTVLKKYHKFAMGHNHLDNTPPSFLKPSTQNLFLWGHCFFKFHEAEYFQTMYYWLL